MLRWLDAVGLCPVSVAGFGLTDAVEIELQWSQGVMTRSHPRIRGNQSGFFTMVILKEGETNGFGLPKLWIGIEQYFQLAFQYFQYFQDRS